MTDPELGRRDLPRAARRRDGRRGDRARAARRDPADARRPDGAQPRPSSSWRSPLGIELIGADLEAIARAEDRELFRTTVAQRRAPDAAQRRRRTSPTIDFAAAGGRAARPSRSAGTAAGSSGRRASCAGRSSAGSRRARSARCSSRSPARLGRARARGRARPRGQRRRSSARSRTSTRWASTPATRSRSPRSRRSPTRPTRSSATPRSRRHGRSASTPAARTSSSRATRRSGELRVIEMNPRVSRSSALASKATGYPDREGRGAARGRLHARRDPERPDRHDDGGVRAGARLRRRQGAAVRLREVPAGADRDLGAEMRAVGESLGIGRTFAEAFAKALVGREVPEVELPTTTASFLPGPASPCPSAGTSCSRPPDGARAPGIHPYFADRLREVVSVNTEAAARRRGSRSTRAQASSRRGRRTTTSPTRAQDEGPEPSGRAVIVTSAAGRTGSGRRSSSTTAASTPPRRSASSATRPCSSTRTPRPSRPTTTPPTASTWSRSSHATCSTVLRARASARRRRLVRGADAAAARPGARARPAIPLLGDPLEAIDAAEDRGRFAELAGDLAPEWGVAANLDEARELAATDRLSGARQAPLRDRRAQGMHVATPRGRARRSRGRASSTASSKVRSSSTSTRSATARRPGWLRCSSTSSRPASTRATRPACCPARRSPRPRRRDPRASRRGSRAGLGARGLLNLQLALAGGRLFVLEANPRASRTVPFVAKATGVPLVEHAVRLLLGERARRARAARAGACLAGLGARRRSSRPSASRARPTRGPEMRSTGEVMASGATPSAAYARAVARRRRGRAAAARSARRCRNRRYRRERAARSSTRSTRLSAAARRSSLRR